METWLRCLIRVALGAFVLPVLIAGSLFVSVIAFCSDKFVRSSKLRS
jgi:hypothetical protein